MARYEGSFKQYCDDNGLDYDKAILYRRKHPELSLEQIKDYFYTMFRKRCKQAGFSEHYCNKALSFKQRYGKPGFRHMSDDMIISRIRGQMYAYKSLKGNSLKEKCDKAGAKYGRVYYLKRNYYPEATDEELIAKVLMEQQNISK